MTNLATSFIRNDRLLFNLINRKLHFRALDWYFGAVTHLGSTPFMVFLSCVSLYTMPIIGTPLTVNLVISQSIIHAFKRLVNRQRPYETMICNLVYNPPECVYSFPSGHSGASLSAFLVLSSAFPTLFPVFLALTFSVGFSRIYLGFHFASDVAAGLLISYLTFHFLSGAILL